MKIEEKIIDFINGELESTDALAIETLIKSDENAKKLYDEYVSLHEELRHFDTESVVDEEWAQSVSESLGKGRLTNSKIVKLNPQHLYLKVAAAAMVLIVGLLGFNNWRQSQLLEQVDNDLALMRQEMRSHLGQSSVSTRIMAVRNTEIIDISDHEILNILMKTLHDDKSAHVRLAAAEALRKWMNLPDVKDSLIGALHNEQDPSVQILLIEILSSINEKEIASSLDQIIDNEATPQFIKDEAYKGKFRITKDSKVY